MRERGSGSPVFPSARKLPAGWWTSRTRYAATLFGGQAVDRMHAVGGGAALPGVVEYLERSLDLPSAGGDPFLALGLEAPRTSRSITPATFATALGLALRGMAA